MEQIINAYWPLLAVFVACWVILILFDLATGRD